MVSYPNQITGPVTVTGGMTVGGGVTATGGATVDTVTVTGNSSAAAYTSTGNITVGATLKVTGLSQINGGTTTAASAPAITPTLANGVASQLSDVTRDYILYLEVGTAGTGFTLSIGPTSGVANAVVTSVTPVTGMLFTLRIPAGWFIKWAGTTTTLANQLAIGC